MAQDILVPNIGDFKSVEIIEVLIKEGQEIAKISRQSTSKWHNQASCLGKGASHIRTNLNFTFRQPEMVGKSP